MYDDIQNPPQQLPQSKFKPWFWLLILPLYLFGCLLALADSVAGWQEFLQLSNLSVLSLVVIVFALCMLIWLSYKLIQGFNKLTECSRYEVYLAEVFENRDRQRPAQNAMRLDYLRKLRKLNSEVRGVTESKQKQLLGMAIIGLLILLAGSIGQLVSQLVII
ncbi:MAG: Cir/Yir/Bir family protein [Kangiella sp.]|nr:Cir/Yir/Bir family protein [Kangiella sp.]